MKINNPDITQAAQIVMARSKPAGNIFGFEFRTCDVLPSNLIMIGYPEKPEDAQFFKIKS